MFRRFFGQEDTSRETILGVLHIRFEVYNQEAYIHDSSDNDHDFYGIERITYSKGFNFFDGTRDQTEVEFLQNGDITLNLSFKDKVTATVFSDSIHLTKG